MVAQPQKDDDLAPGTAPCSGRVKEIRKPTGSKFTLKCDKGKCPQGTGPCGPLSRTNKHGTKTEWCGCSKVETRRCTPYIERQPDGTARVDCFTTDFCGPGKLCTLVPFSKVVKPGETEIWWGCECQTITN
jgi:hypothetical protein